MNKNCTEENNNCQCSHGASYMANEDYVKGCFGKARIRKAFGKIFHTCEKKIANPKARIWREPRIVKNIKLTKVNKS